LAGIRRRDLVSSVIAFGLAGIDDGAWLLSAEAGNHTGYTQFENSRDFGIYPIRKYPGWLYRRDLPREPRDFGFPFLVRDECKSLKSSLKDAVLPGYLVLCQRFGEKPNQAAIFRLAHPT
jgi:hypothetical protein